MPVRKAPYSTNRRAPRPRARAPERRAHHPKPAWVHLNPGPAVRTPGAGGRGDRDAEFGPGPRGGPGAPLTSRRRRWRDDHSRGRNGQDAEAALQTEPPRALRGGPQRGSRTGRRAHRSRGQGYATPRVARRKDFATKPRTAQAQLAPKPRAPAAPRSGPKPTPAGAIEAKGTTEDIYAAGGAAADDNTNDDMSPLLEATAVAADA